MAYQSFAIAQVFIRNGQKSVALEIPMIVPQGSLLFGFLAIACAVMVRFMLGPPIAEQAAATSGIDAPH
jgi:TRAP-type C4-dicarboxylate transport system permease small subunit